MKSSARSAAVLSLLLAAAMSGPLPTASAEVIHAGPADDVESIIDGLSPGDELVLADGMYLLDDGAFRFTAIGTESAPIVVRAADGATPHFHRPLADENIWEMNVAYFTLRGIELSGGSAGLRVTAADHLTIEDCHLHDIGDVAIRMNDGGTYESPRILRNHIHHTHHTGEAMYLGCNGDSCRVLNGLIEGNHIHDLALDTSESGRQGDGIEIKEGGAGNIVRDNVIHDTNYPCILADSTVGNGGPNIIERNVLWNCGDHGIQVSQDAIIRNNIILSARADGIAIQPHQSGIPTNLVIVHNTILEADGYALSLRQMAGPVTVANNAIYARDAAAVYVVGSVSMLTFAGNVGVGSLSGPPASGLIAGAFPSDMVAPHYDGDPPIDVFPSAGSTLIGAGDAAHVTEDDFNGTPREGRADVGAYAFDGAGNPGWGIAPEHKELIAAMPGTDGGVVSPADGGTTGDGGTMADAGVARDGGTAARTDAGSRIGPTAGCSCRTAGASATRAGSSRPLGSALFALFAGAALARRRRLRRAAASCGRDESSVEPPRGR
jgi:hypothetical protein